MAEIIMVTSGKGGSGKSTFTVGVSRALAQLGKKVLAVDCDIGLRSLDLLFGVSEQVVFDWGDLLSERCTAEQAVSVGSIGLLAAPLSYSDSFTEDGFSRLIHKFDDKYDFIFIDSPAGIDRGFSLAASGAKRAIAVTTPDSVCVRSCNRAFRELDRLGVADVRLVINMFESKPVCKHRLLNIDQCIDETGVQLLGIVPRDPALAFCSVTGDAPGEFSSSTLAFRRIAKRLCGEKAPLICE